MSSNKTSTSTATKKAPAAKATTKKTATPATPADNAEKRTPTEQKPKATAKTVEKKDVAEVKKAAPRRKTEKKDTADAAVAQENETRTSTQSGGDESKSDEPVTVEKYIADMLNRKKEEGRRLREEIQWLRDLKMAYNRQMRDMKKTKRNRQTNKDGAQKNPSGFAQPTRIREPLCEFLGLEVGSSIARTDVTRRVIEYIQGNELEDKSNRRNIEPDDALERLVGNAEERLRTMEARKRELDDIAASHPNDKKKQEKAQKCVVTDKLTYFNLQVHLNKHFIKEERRKGTSPVVQDVTEESTIATAVA